MANETLVTTEWMDLLRVVSRVTAIIGRPPDALTVVKHFPIVMWDEPDDPEAAAIVLEYVDGKLTMHVSEGLSEADVLPLIGVCVTRGVEWSVMAGHDDDQQEESESLPLVSH